MDCPDCSRFIDESGPASVCPLPVVRRKPSEATGLARLFLPPTLRESSFCSGWSARGATARILQHTVSGRLGGGGGGRQQQEAAAAAAAAAAAQENRQDCSAFAFALLKGKQQRRTGQKARTQERGLQLACEALATDGAYLTEILHSAATIASVFCAKTLKQHVHTPKPLNTTLS